MNARLRRVLHLAASLACLPGLGQAQSDGLKHDPFVRPVLVPRPATAAAVPASTVKATVPEPVWKPELWAIILAGPRSIVNVEGALLRIGEHINGYRLVEVHEESAVFVNDKKKVTLSLRGVEPLSNTPPRPDARGTNERRDDSRKPGDK